MEIAHVHIKRERKMRMLKGEKFSVCVRHLKKKILEGQQHQGQIGKLLVYDKNAYYIKTEN